MLFYQLVKTGKLDVGGRLYQVRSFMVETARGVQRYSAELTLGPNDRIIVDGGSLTEVELKISRLGPTTIYSRSLARQAA
jgi:hypothetical protein